MLKKILYCIVCMFLIATPASSQELQAKVTVLSNRVSNTVDKKIFQTLQTSLANFLNNRKWTRDAFQANEKIQCNFLLNIDQEQGNNIYKASLTVQAARPIYNGTYTSPLINFIDNDVTFRYQEFQAIEFNENRVQGTDPVASNLSAVFAYYVNMILGFDYGSFSLKGGEEYFKKAWNIVNSAPESREITGWKSFDGLRNRYWLAENLSNNRYAIFHDALYSYYRSGMDVFYENEDEGRSGILNSINFLNTLNTDNPNLMIVQFFFQGKSNELVKIFNKASTDLKTRAKNILTKLDLSNATVYRDLR